MWLKVKFGDTRSMTQSNKYGTHTDMQYTPSDTSTMQNSN